MLSTENKRIGTSEHRHDLAALNEPLRSHGGLIEQAVSFITSRVLPDQPDAPALRNFDAFYYAVMAAAQVGKTA
jgi:phosphonoacetate hydrolase